VRVAAQAAMGSVTLTTSWDVWRHRRMPFELYGSEGSLWVPDPNYFGGLRQENRPQVCEGVGSGRVRPPVCHPTTIESR
jgi:hypothetical protein